MRCLFLRCRCIPAVLALASVVSWLPHAHSSFLLSASARTQLLVVGTVKDLQIAPRQLTSGFFRVYKFEQNNAALRLLHKTAVSDVPLAICAFQGKMLAGVGKALRVYELGRRKLLRKSENAMFPTTINSISVQGDRIYVGGARCMLTSLSTWLFTLPGCRLRLLRWVAAV